jgi:hypothetical protein
MEAMVGTLLGTGWASGVNLYATVFLLSLFGRLGIAEMPEVLTSPWVLGAAAAMYVVEFVADKIPYVDSIWDSVHTIIRPLGAALIGMALAGDDLSQLFSGGLASATALGAHVVKAGARVAINTSPEPVTNIGVSLVEDVTVLGMVWFAVSYPWIAAIAAIVLLLLGGVVLVAAWRLVRRGMVRFRHWRARRSVTAHLR